MEAPRLPPEANPGVQGESRAQLLVGLVQHAFTAPDIASAILPALDILVAHTAAVGAAYFQRTAETFSFAGGSGLMPGEPKVNDLLVHGLPADIRFFRLLEENAAPLFFTNTQRAAVVAQAASAGVASLAAAPVWNRDGSLLGVFLMYSSERHRWKVQERDLFSAVTWTLAALITRLVAEDDAIRALGTAVENRDASVKAHLERVTELAVQVGRQLGVDSATLASLRRGASLHDLGKLATPDLILHKPGLLTPDERQVMQQHAEKGHRVAQQLAFLPQAALDVVLYHHEHWDGLGYPYGLAGEAIPLTARIFAVCDVYDVLTSVRPYKPAWSQAQALTEIEAQVGKHFDPHVVEAFLKLFEPVH